MLLLGSVAACGSDSAPEEPKEKIEVNGQSVEVGNDGSIEVDGVSYEDGGASWTSSYNWMSSKTTVICQGPDLVQENISTGYKMGGSSSQRVVGHAACADGKIQPGELTKLPPESESQDN